MKIDRGQLISNLFEFSLQGSGVVIGQPGVGKSYALAELRDRLKEREIPHLILPVERLGSASATELKAVLKRSGDLVSLLRAVQVETRPGILIFDGYDAARGESQRAGVLQLIQEVVTELSGEWNIIVSVRTFDAAKSQRLLAMFPDSKARSDPTIGQCRQFNIPPLDNSELAQALLQIPTLNSIHNSGNSEFKSLLKIPFNLWLLEKLLHSGAEIGEFSAVISEVQLLDMYWRYRVRSTDDSADREFVLKTASQAMVVDHKLTVKRERVYQPAVRGAWDGLLSDETISEVSGRDVSVAFSHNILFDFAVSAHLLESEPQRLAQFVAEEPARPLFLRPSLVYHFTRLWHFERQTFWHNFWSIIQRDEVHLRQIIRLVLPAVIVNEARSESDLSPLVERLVSRSAPAVEAVTFLVQALRVLKSQNRILWSRFLRDIGPHLDRHFAWDAGIVATSLAE